MTICMCAVLPEGVVFGADSTSTVTLGDGSVRFLNNEQKLFEVGTNSSIGVVTWGMGRIDTTSHRTLIARLGDELAVGGSTDMKDVATRFGAIVWPVYEKYILANAAQIAKWVAVDGDPKATPEDKKQAKGKLDAQTLGFCIGGHCSKDRQPDAYQLTFVHNLGSAPVPTPVVGIVLAGQPALVNRILGFDRSAADDILATGQWTGTKDELNAIFDKYRIDPVLPVPVREAVDLIHALIYLTIKIMKFTSLPPVCGGPIELATVTTDRTFRWVHHKDFATAITLTDRGKRR